MPVMMSSAAVLAKTFRATRKPFRARAKTVRLHPGIAVRLQPGIPFVFTPESFSRSPRNPFRLAPESARTTQHAGYGISQRKRKRIEESFGWLKTIALMRKVRHRGIHKVGWVFTFAAAAYNLVRMRNLLSPAVQSAY